MEQGSSLFSHDFKREMTHEMIDFSDRQAYVFSLFFFFCMANNGMYRSFFIFSSISSVSLHSMLIVEALKIFQYTGVQYMVLHSSYLSSAMFVVW